jgi:hypothetical protein
MVKRVRVVKSAIQGFKLKSTGRAFHESPGVREETGEKVYEIELARGGKDPMRRDEGPHHYPTSLEFWSR